MVEVSWAGGERAGRLQRLHQHHRLRPRQASWASWPCAIGNMDVPVVAVSAKRDEHKKKTRNITMVIQVKSREQLDRVFTQLHKRSDIIEVYRGST